MNVSQVLGVHGVKGAAGGSGKSKFKLWELPIYRTDSLEYQYYNASNHNYWYALNHVKLFQPYNTTYATIYLRNKSIVSPTVGALYYTHGQVLIDDNGDVYILSVANMKIYTLKASEKYSTLYESPLTNLHNNRVGLSNFKYGNYIFFLVTNGSDNNLVKFDISSGKAVQVAQVQTLFGTGNDQCPVFIKGNSIYYTVPNTNGIYIINLDTMVRTVIPITPPSGYTISAYVGYYNGTHFVGAYENNYKFYVICEYTDAGAMTNWVTPYYDTKLVNDLGVQYEQWYGVGFSNIQASDKVTAITVGVGTTYNDSLIFFDMSKKKAIRIHPNMAQGSYLWPCGTLNKVMSVKTGNFSDILQFELDTTKT